ncbi:hypothetical protein L6164_030128 [Bauhinia variegata]|uniref:Uncharacterized protein n=1 Tax=Bauhinia variegata TaxID=167791 RepID=A0ACB9LB70_BAUVA|nr:hypothetical protein L6164_030128 [Bauhinia variegata]
MATPEGTRNVSTEYDPDEISKVCVPNRHAGSNGVWIGDNPFEFVLPVTLIQLFLAFAVSRALYRILRPLRTPTLVCNTVGGILLGPSFLGLNQQFKESLYPPTQLGQWLPWVLFYPVLSQALLELNLITSELGHIALSSAMINDALEWVSLVVGAMTRNRQHSAQFLTCYLLMICLCVFITRPAMLIIEKRTPEGKPVKEIYIVLILLGVLIMAAISDIIGLSFLQGPLLLGLIMPNGAPLGTTLAEKSEVIILQFLLPLFFIYIGLHHKCVYNQRLGGNNEASILPSSRIHGEGACVYADCKNLQY